MNMNVDQARDDDLAGSVEPASLRRRLETSTQLGNHAVVANQNVELIVELLGGIDHPATVNEQAHDWLPATPESR